VGAATGGAVTATRFEVTGSNLCGVFVSSRGGEMDLSEGVVSGNTIGACLPADYARERVTTNVRYVDNATSISVVDVEP
jgi:hypothetical protein